MFKKINIYNYNIYILFFLHIIFVFFYIYYKASYIQLLYKKQRLEKYKSSLDENLNYLIYQSLVLKDKKELINYGINNLNMNSINLSNIKEID